jgi:pyridoxal phosphate enzyme (YggS family)
MEYGEPWLVEQILKNWQKINASIRQFEVKYQRDPNSVDLLAVSKGHSIEAIRYLYEAGQRAFGENYLQEAQMKMAALKDFPISWHFIGPLQTNKIASIAQAFDYVHSVSRLKEAVLLNQARKNLLPLNILVQVNIDRESNKSGVYPEEVKTLVQAIQDLPNLSLGGLMCIPAPQPSYSDQLLSFSQLKNLSQKLNEDLKLNLSILSMGMSGDLEAAISAGSTLVRIGTALFGKRE